VKSQKVENTFSRIYRKKWFFSRALDESTKAPHPNLSPGDDGPSRFSVWRSCTTILESVHNIKTQKTTKWLVWQAGFEFLKSEP
jgi:hypothetical protein